jgi:hypothetical protein
LGKWRLKFTSFKVKKQVLIDNSRFFKVKLLRWKSNEADDFLEEDSCTSLEIWFKLLHGKELKDTLTVPVDEMWHVIAAADKYEFTLKKLDGWFEDWYAKQDLRMISKRKLLYPCFEFGQAQGFVQVTRELVYGSKDHIEESNPAKYKTLHLPKNVIDTRNRSAFFFL